MNKKTRYIVLVGMLSAIATALYYLLEIPIGMGHLKVNFSDVPALAGGMILGPLAGVIIEFVKALLHLFRTSTFGIGELIDFTIGSALILTFYYTHKAFETKKWGKLVAVVATSAVCVVIGMAANYLLFPPYFKLMGSPVNMTIVMGAVYSSIPMNIVKVIITTVPIIPIVKTLQQIYNKDKTKS